MSFIPQRLTIGAALAVLFLAAGGIASDAAGGDRDLEAGLANLRAGNDGLASEYLMRYYQRQPDPDIRGLIDLALAQVKQQGQSLTLVERGPGGPPARRFRAEPDIGNEQVRGGVAVS